MKNETSGNAQSTKQWFPNSSNISDSLSPVTCTALQTSLEHVKAHNATGFVSKIKLCVRERLQIYERWLFNLPQNLINTKRGIPTSVSDLSTEVCLMNQMNIKVLNA